MKVELARFVIWFFRVRWIVSKTTGDMGVRVCGFNFWYYKWPDPMAADYPWRVIRKREFGESVKSDFVTITDMTDEDLLEKDG